MKVFESHGSIMEDLEELFEAFLTSNLHLKNIIEYLLNCTPAY